MMDDIAMTAGKKVLDRGDAPPRTLPADDGALRRDDGEQAMSFVSELQANNTALVTENRMLRAKYDAAYKLLVHVLVDASIVERLHGSTPNAETEERIRMTLLSNVAAVLERNTLLENDAWTQTTQTAKAFVKEVREIAQKRESKTLSDELVAALLADLATRYTVEFDTVLSR